MQLFQSFKLFLFRYSVYSSRSLQISKYAYHIFEKILTVSFDCGNKESKLISIQIKRTNLLWNLIVFKSLYKERLLVKLKIPSRCHKLNLRPWIERLKLRASPIPFQATVQFNFNLKKYQFVGILGYICNDFL